LGQMRYVAAGVVTMKVVRLVAVVGLLAFTDCGGAAPPAASPEGAADAEAPCPDCDQPGYGQPSYGTPGGPAQKSAPPPPATAPGADSATPLLLPDRKLDTLDDALTSLADDQKLLDQALLDPIPTAELGLSACRQVCSAIGSMRRSADAICSLAGDDDSRCRDARSRVDENEQRIANAGCSC
jgi:hypothetical protein